MAIDLDAIKRVRARVEVSIADARAALEATGGDVEAAIARLITPEQAMRDRGWELTRSLLRDIEAGVSPRAPPSRPATVVTMETSAAAVIAEHAPELEAALRVVPATCAMAALERAWTRSGDGSFELVVSADFHSPDPARDRATIAASTARHHHALRAEVTRDELGREVVRIATSVPSTDAVAGTLQGPNLAGVADMFERARRGRGLPLAVRRRWVFALPDAHELLATREGIVIAEMSCYEEGWFVHPGNEDRVRVLDHDGEVSIDIVRQP